MAAIASIEDLKRLHRARVPRMFYDYAESGSYTEQTFRENTSDFNKLRFRQKVAVDMTGRTTASTMIGQPVAMPVALAPPCFLRRRKVSVHPPPISAPAAKTSAPPSTTCKAARRKGVSI